MSVQTNAQFSPLCEPSKNICIGKENHLIASLPPRAYQKLAPYFQPVFLKQGERLHTLGERLQEVYFPIDCLISITIIMSDGVVVDTGLVGYREMLGINACLGIRETPQTDCVVQISGRAIKINAQILHEAFNCDQELRNVLLRYMQAFIIQVSQIAACNGIHNLEQRLVRRLLEVQDRVGSDNLRLTHEVIANMLGVRRSGVTQAAQHLQDKGLIRYSRGHICILNQTGLEACSCECFRTIKDECDRLLGTEHRSSA